MIVALYARVSTVRQAEKDLSIPDQLRQMREWCQRCGHSVAVEYIEPGASATDDKRPVFQQMISEACASPPPFEALIVHSLSRFFRDSLELGLYERRLRRSDVKLISITQQTSDDSGGDMVRKFFSIVDEYQSKENSKHTLRAMLENARQGYFNGSNPPFGYKAEEVEAMRRRGKKKHLVMEPAEAGLVRRVFDLYLDGHQGHSFGLLGVASVLNEQGLTFRGHKWSKGRVEAILANSAYIGNFYFNQRCAKTGKRKPRKEWVLCKVPPIIDENRFKEAQERRESRQPEKVSPRVISSPTLLTGLLRCGVCDAGMTLATGKGGQYRYYKCSTRIRHGNGCHSGNVPTAKLDNLITSSLADRVFTEDRVRTMLRELQQRLQGAKSQATERLSQLRKELEKNRQGTDRLFEAVEKGLLPLDAALEERAHRLKAQRGDILADIAAIQRQEGMPEKLLLPRNVRAFCKALKERMSDTSTGFAKEYLRLLVDEIRVEGKTIRMRGSYGKLARAVAQKNPGTPEGVPRFGHAWLPGQDSNLQPSG